MMVPRISAFFVLFSCILACQPAVDCTSPKERKYAIADTASHWFEQTQNNMRLSASSNKGKTESYDIDLSSNYQYWKDEDCQRLMGEQRDLAYISSLYGYRFYLNILQHEGSDLFSIS
jgi:hypothetical protein